MFVINILLSKRWRCTFPFIISFDIVKMAAAVTSRLTTAVCRQFQRFVTVSSHTQSQYATQALSKFHSCQQRYVFLADNLSSLNVNASWYPERKKHLSPITLISFHISRNLDKCMARGCSEVPWITEHSTHLVSEKDWKNFLTCHRTGVN